MSSTHATPSLFVNVIIPSTATPTIASVTRALPVANAYLSRSGGFTPSAIIGIVATIVVLLLCVPLVAILLRRYERQCLIETAKASGRSDTSLNESVMEGSSLRSILVTRELRRSSYKVVDGVEKPDGVYMSKRGRDEFGVRGGGMK